MITIPSILAIIILFVHEKTVHYVSGNPAPEIMYYDDTSEENGYSPKMEALLGASSLDQNQPVFPERSDAVYFVVAVHGGAKIWGRTLARTLLDLGSPFSNPQGPPLRPIVLDLPPNGRYSANVLTVLCDLIDGIPLAGMIVIGDGQAAHMIALSGSAMRIPVLWAKGGIASLQGTTNELMSKSQAILQPAAREILSALRSLLLQAHWNSFYILSDIETTMVLSGADGLILKRNPLRPTILQLPTNNELIYRQLARISQSTRGVVILLCDLSVVRRILSEAQRMQMLNGHFIWLWADTMTTTEFYDPLQIPFAMFGAENDEETIPHKTNPFHSVKSNLEEDFYDSSDIIQQSHIADLVERKMDFEYYDPKHKKNMTKSESIRRSNHFDDVGKNNQGYESPVEDTEQRDEGERSTNMSEGMHGETAALSTAGNYTSNRELFKIIRTNNIEKDNRQQYDQSKGAIHKTTDNSRGNRRNQKTSVHAVFNDIYNLFGVEENIPDFKMKRANNLLKHYNVSSHVLFHHFQDFPVGLLALRPVTMKVDRHFIRSTVRLFASTWAKVEYEGESTRNSQRVSEKQQQTNRSSLRYNKSQQYKRPTRSLKDQIRSSNVIVNFSKIRENKVNNSFTTEYSDHRVNLRSWASISQNTTLSDAVHYKQPFEPVNNVMNNKIINTTNESNSRFTETVLRKPIPSRQKRQQTWWTSRSHNDPSRNNERVKGWAPRYRNGCYGNMNRAELKKANILTRYLQEAVARSLTGQPVIGGISEKSLITHFEILNLVPVTKRTTTKNDMHQEVETNLVNTSMTKWRRAGIISGRNVHLDTIVWPSGDIVVAGLSSKPRSVFRVVVALAPPFVMETGLGEQEQCLRGLTCYMIYSTGRHNLTQIFNKIEIRSRMKVSDFDTYSNEEKALKKLYSVRCCYGLSMDLLQKVADDLGFAFDLYIVHDGLFGRKTTTAAVRPDTVIQGKNKQTQLSKFDAQSGRSLKRGSKLTRVLEQGHETKPAEDRYVQKPATSFTRSKSYWNGIIGELVARRADLSFAPLSVSKERAEVIDFSIPFFHGGVSLLAAPQSNPDVPLLAFLLPFSPELWIAIFVSLNVTAVAVAIYEWLSPFGLNPWGRQRSKNFSMSSALWVMWGLLCGHLVAFKAPKSWPNKFLINVWGGFSVIFVASYTANIAALIAGLFFHNEAGSYSGPLMKHRIGAPVSTATEYYIQHNDHILWEHMKKYKLQNIEDGINRLKNGTIDLLMADSPILDYYRATDYGCTLQKVGDIYVDDSYAIGLSKGFPLKETISALISKYSSDGYLDILTEKWYGGLACFKLDREISQPKPLGVAAVAGVFLLLGLGMILGLFILIFEHLFYKYTLPILRHQPKHTIWRSRNIMFFSQKLYRFINCVELVSPHHAAKELVHTIRQGQITSLFQKSIKRKEDEQRRRRKSKAQFFDMIQEIRRNMYLNKVQQEERNTALQAITKNAVRDEFTATATTPAKKPKHSPKSIFGIGRHNSNPSTLNVRRFSTDSILSERLDTIGRRLSRDMTNSPPDLAHRFETFGKPMPPDSKYDTYSGIEAKESVAVDKFDTVSGKIEGTNSNTEKLPQLPVKTRKQNKRKPLNPELYVNSKITSREEDRRLIPISERVAQGLAPPFIESDASSALLRDKLHEELRIKYGGGGFIKNSLKQIEKNECSRRVNTIATNETDKKVVKATRHTPKNNKYKGQRFNDSDASNAIH